MYIYILSGLLDPQRSLRSCMPNARCSSVPILRLGGGGFLTLKASVCIEFGFRNIRCILGYVGFMHNS